MKRNRLAKYIITTFLALPILTAMGTELTINPIKPIAKDELKKCEAEGLNSNGTAKNCLELKREQIQYLNNLLSRGGGVVDGGGTQLKLSTKKDIIAAIDKSYELITTKLEGHNFLNRLREKAHIHTLPPGSWDYYIKNLKLHNDIDVMAQMLSGHPQRLKEGLYLKCHVDGIRYKKLYTTVIPYEAPSCKDLTVQENNTVESYLPKSKILLQDKCYDFNGNEKLGSVNSFTFETTICLSESRLKTIAKTNILRTVLGALIHEITHMHGADEQLAKEFEIFAKSHFGEIIHSINNYKNQVAEKRFLFYQELKSYQAYYSQFEKIKIKRVDFKEFTTSRLNKLEEIKNLYYEYEFHKHFDYHAEDRYLNMIKSLRTIIGKAYKIEDMTFDNLKAKNNYFTIEELHILKDINEGSVKQRKKLYMKLTSLYSQINKEFIIFQKYLKRLDFYAPTKRMVSFEVRVQRNLHQSENEFRF